jgi:deoxyribodipyrimidine photolyase-related protein
MYADAVDWVSLPNTLGMSQYGDGGIVGTKPYCATGQYIHRMGNYCGTCLYEPRSSTGPQACPFTTLYWDFLDRHHDKLASNPRLRFQIQNLARKRLDKEAMTAIRQEADKIRSRVYR